MGVDSDLDNPVSKALVKYLIPTLATIGITDHANCELVFFILLKVSLTEGSERRSTKQESAWLFRIWYNFDHKYPLVYTLRAGLHYVFLFQRDIKTAFSPLL